MKQSQIVDEDLKEFLFRHSFMLVLIRIIFRIFTKVNSDIGPAPMPKHLMLLVLHTRWRSRKLQVATLLETFVITGTDLFDIPVLDSNHQFDTCKQDVMRKLPLRLIWSHDNHSKDETSSWNRRQDFRTDVLQSCLDIWTSTPKTSSNVDLRPSYKAAEVSRALSPSDVSSCDIN